MEEGGGGGGGGGGGAKGEEPGDGTHGLESTAIFPSSRWQSISIMVSGFAAIEIKPTQGETRGD